MVIMVSFLCEKIYYFIFEITQSFKEKIMIHMLCRNKVEDFEKWKSIFDSHAKAHQEAGLKLLHLWHSLEDKNDVYFLFEVADIKKINLFLNTPSSLEAQALSGVIEKPSILFLQQAEI